jgi:aryl-alcohol dehydrogenase-like predicted oxidoreductase
MSYRVLDAYRSAGGNFIDTADIYSSWHPGHRGGEAETVIGTWMKRRGNRRELVVATKGMLRMWDGPTGEGATRVHLMRACDDSLKRLRTDYLDLYQIHWPDRDTPNEETMRALGDLVCAGKIRYAGVSNYSAGLLGEAAALGRWGDFPPVVSTQPNLSLMVRDFEKDQVALVKSYGVAVIPYSPLCGGFLTGKYRREKPLPQNQRVEWQKHLIGEKLWNVVEALEKLGKKRGKTIAQMALGWLLTRDWITAPIVGANSPEQLKESLGAAGLKLDPAEMKTLDEVSN